MSKNKKKKNLRRTFHSSGNPPADSFANPNGNSLKKDNPIPQIISHTRTTSAFQGPIPPPDLLAKYCEIIPNGGDRILQMAEKQSNHRQYIEKWAVISGAIQAQVGVFCALIIALFGLYWGYKLIINNQIIEGSIFAGTCLVSLVSAFLYGTRSRKDERLQKNRQNLEILRQK